jgi:hypothetical protein
MRHHYILRLRKQATDRGHGLKRAHEFGHDAEDAPRIFADELVVISGPEHNPATKMKQAGEFANSPA